MGENVLHYECDDGAQPSAYSILIRIPNVDFNPAQILDVISAHEMDSVGCRFVTLSRCGGSARLRSQRQGYRPRL